MVLNEAPSASIRIRRGAEDVPGRQRTGLSDAAELALLTLGEDYGIAGHVLLDVSGTTNVIYATGH
jgi:hypothetical protein